MRFENSFEYAGLREMLHGRLVKPDGRSAVVAARRDPRISYCFYVPTEYRRVWKFRNLLLYIHGEGRRFQFLLNTLRPLARECGYLLVCPLFPANVLRDGNLSGYKYLKEGEIRYDELLLDIVAEFREVFAFEESRFLLGGFSGGAQFAHRFYYLYPEMLESVSIAAPGNVTLLDNDLEWPAGIGSISDVFGRQVDIDALKTVDVQLIVGDADTKVSIEPEEDDGPGHPNSNDRNRIDRLRSLHESLLGHGIDSTLDFVPELGHSFGGLAPKIIEFLQQGSLHRRSQVIPETK
jgi:pimeloyl-ACP methyl ester carboxylesterase